MDRYLILPPTSGHLAKRAIPGAGVHNENKERTKPTNCPQQIYDTVQRAGIGTGWPGRHPKVAQDLGLARAALCAWRAKRRQTGQPFEGQKPRQAEMAGLKRGNARLEEGVASPKKATACFAELPK